MKIPPLLLAAAIAFWGWQSGQWLVAGVVAVVFCASFYVDLRWALTTRQVHRVADACAALALLAAGAFYVSVGNPRVLVLLFQWLPLIFLPLALAHAYGTAEGMDLGALFWRLRRHPPPKPVTFDPWFSYFVMWLVAAAAANARGKWFYVGLVALVAWPLLRSRPRSYHVAAFGAALAVAIGLGYALQYNLNVAQSWLEEAVPEWISGEGSLTDPYRSSTSMGSIGKLKESDAIVLRVVTEKGAAPPTLLHMASYNIYFDASWLARDASFERLRGEPGRRWPLVATPDPAARVTIYDYTARLNPVLSLPGGTSALEGMTAISAEHNRLGTVQVTRSPGFFSYVAAYRGPELFEGGPTEADLQLPNKEREAFEALAARLGLRARPTGAALVRVMQHFANGYEYSTYLEAPSGQDSPLVDFLLRSRAGHCEYFATATVLLLRAGGVPARYATGFALSERSELEDAYIARQRHRHAWVHAYVDGRWVEIDTTPPSWLSEEAKQSGAWTWLRDRWSWLRFRIAQAWANGEPGLLLGAALVLLVPTAAWLAWRLYRSRRKSSGLRSSVAAAAQPSTGADSEYYRIEQRQGERGLGRRPHESALDWLARLVADDPDGSATALAEIVELHNRYRFDPSGLPEAQRLRLKQASEHWLARCKV